MIRTFLRTPTGWLAVILLFILARAVVLGAYPDRSPQVVRMCFGTTYHPCVT